MQGRWSPLRASLVLGPSWGLWHFHPVNFTILSRFAWLHFLLIIPTTILFTWLFNGTGGSVLAAVLFHMSLDVAEWVVPLGLYEGNIARLTINAAVQWALAILIIMLAWRRTTTASDLGGD